MRAWRPGMRAAALEEFGCDASSSTTGGASILRPAELRIEPSFGSSSKTGASEVRVALVNPFLKLRQRRPPSRTDHTEGGGCGHEDLQDYDTQAGETRRKESKVVGYWSGI